MPRPANVNTRPDHEIWSIQDGSKMKDYFGKVFPRVDWNAMGIADTEWDRFAKAQGTTYPYCQYSEGSAAVPVASQSLSGVCLVGDACHAFPPDIGQGINAGLQDVVALDRVLQGLDIETGKPLPDKNKPARLGEALELYQKNRGPEHKALARLAKIGAPYQYRQSWVRDRFGMFFWTLNVAFRFILNKISGGLIPSVAFVGLQEHDLSYRQVMRRAAMTSRVLKALLLAALLPLWLKKRGL
jgi:kynurenine 3-monooxygenase